MDALCGLFGYSRQSYYKREDDSDGFKESAIIPIIVETVKRYREQNPGLGSVKLYVIIRRKYGDVASLPGRDAFISLLRANGLMVRMKRRRHYRTTDSDHPYRKYPNLVEGLTITYCNQVWASDITYVETDEGVCYLSLITDLFSHKIMGWTLGVTLEAIYCIEALQRALTGLDDETTSRLIHHSDRGIQYCSSVYVSVLMEHHVRISMTQGGDPRENPVAERANGILKTEWLYKMQIPTRSQCEAEISRIIDFYNNERPHMSIGYKTPSEVYQTGLSEKKCWKNYYAKQKVDENGYL